MEIKWLVFLFTDLCVVFDFFKDFFKNLTRPSLKLSGWRMADLGPPILGFCWHFFAQEIKAVCGKQGRNLPKGSHF